MTSSSTTTPSLRRRRPPVVCVATSVPSSSSVGGAASGAALSLICPQTGSVHSSLRIQDGLSSAGSSLLGVSFVSLFPCTVSSALQESLSTSSVSGSSKTPPRLALAYGSTPGNTSKQGVAMLLSLSAHRPQVHWKARLPEAHLSGGIIVSPCGHYALGGGSSGSLYVWSMLQNSGHLIRSVPRVHYRAVTQLLALSNGHHVITAGADGMVQVYQWMDLVEQSPNNSSTSSVTVRPIATWSQHAVPVTRLVELASPDRIASVSQDGSLVMMDVVSHSVLAQIQLPQGIDCMVYNLGKLWLGGSTGTIYLLNMDTYALHQTLQLGATVVSQQKSCSIKRKREDTGASGGGAASYLVELRGHEPQPITAMVTYNMGNEEWLVSGDGSGTLRIWDVLTRVCVRVLCPWSSVVAGGGPTSTSNTNNPTSGNNNGRSKQQHQHPITSLTLLDSPDFGDDEEETGLANRRVDHGTFTGGGVRGSSSSALALVQRLVPLQKYPPAPPDSPDPHSVPVTWAQVPLWNPTRDDKSLAFWDVTACTQVLVAKSKQLQRQRPSTTEEPAEKDSSETPCMDEAANDKTKQAEDSTTGSVITTTGEEVQRLKKELHEAKATIARWEKVNNKLMAKLQNPKN